MPLIFGLTAHNLPVTGAMASKTEKKKQVSKENGFHNNNVQAKIFGLAS